MTPEITALDAQINALKAQRDVLEQAHLATLAIAPVGALITWGKGGRFMGEILSYIERYGAVRYRVRHILKDGTSGAVRVVCVWDEPAVKAV